MAERIAHTTDTSPSDRRLRFELIFASAWLAIGLFLVPAVIFWVGVVMLGPYGEEGRGGGMGSFYADFFGDLATGEVRTWLLALGPLILVSIVRAIFFGKRPATEPAEPKGVEHSSPPRSAEPRRLEPRIGDDSTL